MAIYKKLQEFAKQGITVKKDADNPFFKSKYTTLNEVLDKVKQPLASLDVLIVQEPTVDGLRTRLIDTTDDTEVSGIMPWVGADNAQKILACTTYYRRGSLISLLGLEDEDDDGNVASTAKPTIHARPVDRTIKGGYGNVGPTKGVMEAKGEPFPNELEKAVDEATRDDLSDIKWD